MGVIEGARTVKVESLHLPQPKIDLDYDVCCNSYVESRF